MEVITLCTKITEAQNVVEVSAAVVNGGIL